MIRRNFLDLDLLDADMTEVVEDVFRYLNESKNNHKQEELNFLL